MAAVALRQHAASMATNSSSNQEQALPAAPLDGSLVVAVFTIRADASVTIDDPDGIWSFLPVTHAATNGGYQTVAWAWATGGVPDRIRFTDAANYKRLAIAEFTGVDQVQLELTEQITERTGAAIQPAILPAEDGDLAILAVIASKQTGSITVDTDDPSWDEVDQGQVGGGFHPRGALFWRTVSGDDVDGAASIGALSGGTLYHGATLITWRAIDNIPTGGEGEPGEPPSELPEHPIQPGNAILEVYATLDEGGPVWGVALWDESYAWAVAGWIDVTPESVVADIHWGTSSAHMGVLADVEAATWTVTTYDPDRRLDPANPESNLYPDVRPFLPIRLRHRSVVVRTGYLERIEYDYATMSGTLRATDNVGRMANAAVPASSVASLSPFLHQRARDAIAAAGLDVDVPHTPTPVPVAELEAGDYTVWQIIALSAREALYVPYMDKDDRLRFRPYQFPADRGARLDETELVGLRAIVSHDGLVSVVVVNDSVDGETTRAVTPTPPYGQRVHRRTEPTLDGDAWAEFVLQDRAAASLRFVPGYVRPLDTDRQEFLATLSIGERLTVQDASVLPVVEADTIILGIRVRVESRGGDDYGVTWQWWYDTGSSAISPLIADYLGDLAPLDWLIDDDTGEYLYPDGVIVTEVL